MYFRCISSLCLAMPNSCVEFGTSPAFLVIFNLFFEGIPKCIHLNASSICECATYYYEYIGMHQSCTQFVSFHYPRYISSWIYIFCTGKNYLSQVHCTEESITFLSTFECTQPSFVISMVAGWWHIANCNCSKKERGRMKVGYAITLGIYFLVPSVMQCIFRCQKGGWRFSK